LYTGLGTILIKEAIGLQQPMIENSIMSLDQLAKNMSPNLGQAPKGQVPDGKQFRRTENFSAGKKGLTTQSRVHKIDCKDISTPIKTEG